MNTKIDWQLPKKSKGVRGFLEILAGPGSTNAELIIQFSFATLAATAMYFYSKNFDWNIWQIIVACYIVFDISGGIATNATSSGKRFWHRVERNYQKHHMFFMLCHFYLPLLVVLFFRPGDWEFFAMVYGYLLVATFFITSFRQYLQRMMAFIFYVGAILMNLYFLTPTIGMEWFIPMLYLKLFLSYLPTEEPYRP